jgi:pimeloyl-ACP methyl ester carboxylesterase
MDPSEPRYAKSGDVHIAYQVVGNGPPDLVVAPGFVSNLASWFEEPGWARLCTRLAASCRVILFDKRGTGLSDRTAGIAGLETRMDDVRAVMDAAGSQRAALFGISEGGPMCMLFAATYPERTAALVLYGSFAVTETRSWSTEQFERRLAEVESSWGTGRLTLDHFAPSFAADEHALRAWARWERLGASPAAALALLRMNREIDARHVLPAIRVPTLVLHRGGDSAIALESGRYLAEHIRGAKFVELPGTDHAPNVGDTDRIVDEIEEFLTGSRHEVEPDRVLATVLFTDIVESTRRAAELGDRDWRALLDRHDQVVREQLARFRGHEVKSLGDGFLATFDGPARAVRCAAAIIVGVRPLRIAVRNGLHAGEIELRREDIGGIAVHIAARVAEIARPGESLVSSTVRDLVAGSGLAFEDRGYHSLRGLPEDVHPYAAVE